MRRAYGPHPGEPSREALLAATRLPFLASAEAKVRAAHDPALPVRDRSFNGGAVLDRINAIAAEHDGDDDRAAIAIRYVALRLAQEWSHDR